MVYGGGHSGCFVWEVPAVTCGSCATAGNNKRSCTQAGTAHGQSSADCDCCYLCCPLAQQSRICNFLLLI